ncbi:MAG: carbohydrate ABC transporter permease [Microbacterium sp.]|jgi:raffinose/stachyose/melibiose transport system permease protein|uniref:carbohydrate ABC transporter permease n=1 Tax=Microbacterium sp. TaxID=51671 RepID=UPI003241CAFE|tara:strand:- start:477 stop:1376 length:900 start_codon:yes stop_codon:yes gene_type:complete
MTGITDTVTVTTGKPRRNPPRAGRKQGKRTALIIGIVAYLVTFLIILPLLWIVLLSFQPSGNILGNPLAFDGLTFDNYINAIASLPLLRMYANTLLIAVVSVTIGTAISFMAAFALTRMVFRRKAQSSVRFYLLAGLAVPVYILLFPVYRLDLALGIFGTYWALILPYIAVTIPFNTLLMTGFLREFPSEIEEAAIIDGVGLWRLCWSVVLPLMRPVIATLLIFNVVYVFNEFPFASILINNPDMVTVSLAVSRFQGQYTVDYGGMMAAATLVLLPQVIIYALFQRQIIAGMTVGAVKG